MLMIIIGSPASGKSTLIHHLSLKGISVFNTDDFITDIYQTDHIGYNIIQRELGNEFLNEKGVDKKKVADWVLKDEQNLEKLNELIHPLIKNEIEKVTENGTWVIELPIIVSSKTKFNYDKLVLTKASPEEIEERISDKPNKEILRKFIAKWDNNIDGIDYVVDSTNGILSTDVNNVIDLLIKK